MWDYIESHGYYSLKKDTPQHTVEYFLLFQFQNHFCIILFLKQISKKPKAVRRHANTMKHNEHVADQLIDFSNVSSNK